MQLFGFSEEYNCLDKQLYKPILLWLNLRKMQGFQFLQTAHLVRVERAWSPLFQAMFLFQKFSPQVWMKMS
jgi:hypothetical protein